MPKNNIILKYPLYTSGQAPIIGHFVINMPLMARIVKVAIQRGVPTIWAMCPRDFDQNMEYHMFIAPTGGVIPGEFEYVATYFDGPFVWHLMCHFEDLLTHTFDLASETMGE